MSASFRDIDFVVHGGSLFVVRSNCHDTRLAVTCQPCSLTFAYTNPSQRRNNNSARMAAPPAMERFSIRVSLLMLGLPTQGETDHSYCRKSSNPDKGKCQQCTRSRFREGASSISRILHQVLQSGDDKIKLVPEKPLAIPQTILEHFLASPAVFDCVRHNFPLVT